MSIDASPGADPGPPSPFLGPHLWLNWQGLLIGQPARASSRDDSVLVRPLWEEYALHSDADLAGELEFGPYNLLMTLANSGRVGRATQPLVFRYHDHLLAESPGVMREELDIGGWTGGDIGDQMAAVLALALGRRVRSGGYSRVAAALLDAGLPAGGAEQRDTSAGKHREAEQGQQQPDREGDPGERVEHLT